MIHSIRNLIVSLPFAEKTATATIDLICRFFRIDLQLHVYNQRGILNYKTDELSGETHFTEEWLPTWLQKETITTPVIFDIGANHGEYCNHLRNAVPDAKIHAFEPHPKTFSHLAKQVGKDSNVILVQSAIGSSIGTLSLHGSPDQNASQHSTLYPQVLSDQLGYKTIESIDVPTTTLDEYTSKNNIDRIHLLKIDTEGHEFDVLIGARKLFENSKIDLVQFEFNEMNIISRRYLKDFFELLPHYNFYRLLPSNLTPVTYSSREEIFLFQNYVAILKSMDSNAQ